MKNPCGYYLNMKLAVYSPSSLLPPTPSNELSFIIRLIIMRVRQSLAQCLLLDAEALQRGPPGYAGPHPLKVAVILDTSLTTTTLPFRRNCSVSLNPTNGGGVCLT